MELKKCSKCKIKKDKETEFYKTAYLCKECHKKKMTKYNKKNKVKLYEYQAKYKQGDKYVAPVYVPGSRKEYYELNKEAHIKRAKKYYQKNKEKLKKYNSEYYHKNKTMINEKKKQKNIEDKNKLK